MFAVGSTFRQRWTWSVVRLAMAVLVPATASAQTPERAARVVYLSATGLSSELMRQFEDALRDAGWVSGRNLEIVYRSADGRYERLPALVDEVLRLKPQVIVASQAPTTQALRKATDTIPIVMHGHGDPVRYGLVTNLARPEGNITGTSFQVNEVGIKLLELLKEAVPSVVRVAFFVNPENPGASPLLEAVRRAAPGLGLQIRPVEVIHTAGIERALDELARERVDAIWIGPEAVLLVNRRLIVDFALRHRIPAVGPAPVFAEAGALMSYAPHGPTLTRATVGYVDKLLKGATPRDLPIERPTRFELVVNARTARALGLTLPTALLVRIDRTIDQDPQR